MTAHPFGRAVAGVLMFVPVVRNEAGVRYVEQSSLGQNLGEDSGLGLGHPKRECYIGNGGELSAVAFGEAKQVDPTLKLVAWKSLGLGVIQGALVEAEPLAHAAPFQRMPLNVLLNRGCNLSIRRISHIAQSPRRRETRYLQVTSWWGISPHGVW